MSGAARREASRESRVVAERYRILRRLGAGGMGSVYEARDLIGGGRVAVKVLRPSLRQNAAAVRRFHREGELLAAIDHPSVVSVLDNGKTDDGLLFLVMELIEGETLRKRMRRGPMSPGALLPIVLHIVDGLEALHAVDIVHRDLKPSNVIVPTTPKLRARGATKMEDRAKLVDFGIARATWRSKLTAEGELVGTLRCMAPEQIGSERDLDGRVDVYQLGVILYDAIHGRHPFQGQPERIVADILRGSYPAPDTGWRSIDRVIAKAMSNNRRERYGSARRLAVAFADAVFAVGLRPSAHERRSPGPFDDVPTVSAGYDAPTVSSRPSPSAPATRSGTRRRTPRPRRRAQKNPLVATRNGGTATVMGSGWEAPRNRLPAPFEVIPTVTYDGMPLSSGAPPSTTGPTERPATTRPTSAKRLRRPGRAHVAALIALALVLGVIVGGVVATFVHG